MIQVLEVVENLFLETSSSVSRNTYAFFCTFCLYQPEDGAPGGLSIEQQVEKDPFKAVISSKPPHGMLVVHTDACDLYTRMWCNYELYSAIRSNVEFHMRFSFNVVRLLADQIWNTTRLLAGDEKVPVELMKMLLVDADSAACSSTHDEIRIRAAVDKLPGRFRK